jgi:hypothetical protein
MTERKQSLRTLGAPGGATKAAPERTPDEQALTDRALEVLRAEFERALELKAKLSDEADVSSEAKGRTPSEKIRSIVASLEGMSRFALGMGLLTPAENRALFAEYMGKGLYEGWR